MPGAGESGSAVRHLVVDAHVHFYPCFERDAFFDAAERNLRRSAIQTGLPDGARGVLMLAETHEDDFFREWAEPKARNRTGRWNLHRTSEECSLIARRDDGAEIVVISGRQIATVEGLEVLALISGRAFPRNLTFTQALTAARGAGAIPVIPWGFGKWWLRRGVLVRQALEAGMPGELFLGDNGGRATVGPRPRLFRIAEAKGIGVLPGSDPLPFPDQVTRPGAYGFTLTGELDLEAPGASLHGLLRGVPPPLPRASGSRTPLPSFWVHQVRMQVRKRRLMPRAGAGRQIRR